MAVLYERHRHELYAYVRTIIGDAHETEDAVQEIFTRALRALSRYDFRRPLRNWLLVIARNHALDVQKRRRRTRVDDPAVLAVLSDHDWRGSRAELPVPTAELLDLIANLPLLQRQVLALHYLLDLPAKDIAEVLDTQPDYVRQAKARGLENIRRDVVGQPAAAGVSRFAMRRRVAPPRGAGFTLLSPRRAAPCWQAAR